MSWRPRRLIAAVCLVAVSTSITGCGSSEPVEKGGKGASSGGASAGHATPEACFAAMQTAVNNNDMAAICDCLTEETQAAMAGMLVMSGRMFRSLPHSPDDEEKHQKMADAMQGVLEKHGAAEAAADAPQNPESLGGPGALLELAEVVKDKRAFIVDMFTALQQFEEANSFGEAFNQQSAGKLHDVKIEGDRATAVVTTAAGTDDPIEFRRTDATGWRLHINLDQAAPAPAA
jgi:hypothetical protein